MNRICICALIACCTALFGSAAFCQEQPQQVSVCDLKHEPSAYNHKLLEVTGFISHGFEDFTLFDPTCQSNQGIWLEYGGRLKSGTMYCCGVTADRRRLKELVVEKIRVPLTRDERFREFDRLIQPPFRSGDFGAIAHATLIGRFFAGEELHGPSESFWGGYGHFGLFSLFAIQAVKSVSPQAGEDLDYGASSDQPKLSRADCSYQSLGPSETAGNSIKAQREAELNQHLWMFEDPKRIASEAIARFAGVPADVVTDITEKRKAPGREVYEWKSTNQSGTYKVVVSRPYWLSFYARDPKQVIWEIVGAYVASCVLGN